MPDVYATIATADLETQHRLAALLELRAADPGQRAMLEAYTRDLKLPSGARVLEVGCGTGAVSRHLATLPEVGGVVGVDPSPVFVQRAHDLLTGERAEFHVADARELPFGDASFDAVVFHATLTHIPDSAPALAEARRVLHPEGRLAIFDGDWTTVTVATGPDDPLQACVDAAVEAVVHDRWLMRRIVPLIRAAGFEPLNLRGHAYTRVDGLDYLLTLVMRGADELARTGRLGTAAAEALTAEARARADAGTFFGHIAYVSVIAAPA